MYEFDSFFSLYPWERAGRVVLSLVFAAVCVAAVRWGSRGLVWPFRLVVAVAVFWGFVWVSPQGCYAYYLLLFDDLTARWVIREVPSPAEMWGHLTFSGRSTLSSHTKGLLGWALILAALLRRGVARAAN